MERIDIPEEEWAAELLPLLDDTAFRVVTHLGLESSTDYIGLYSELKAAVFPERE